MTSFEGARGVARKENQLRPGLDMFIGNATLGGVAVWRFRGGISARQSTPDLDHCQ